MLLRNESAVTGLSCAAAADAAQMLIAVHKSATGLLRLCSECKLLRQAPAETDSDLQDRSGWHFDQHFITNHLTWVMHAWNPNSLDKHDVRLQK